MCITLLHVPAKQINNCGAHLKTKEMLNDVGSKVRRHQTSFNIMDGQTRFNDAERCRKEMLEPFAQGVTYRFLFPEEDGFE